MKNLCLTLFALLVMTSINAQGVKAGVKAGMNIPTITGDNTDNLSSFVTYHVGAFANIEVSDTFSIQPECMFSCQGAEYTESEGYDGEFVLGYLNVPVMASLEVAEGFSVQAGPQIGILLSAEDKYENEFESGEEDAKEFFKDIDFGVNFGASYEFANGIGVGARYNLGISNILEDDGGEYGEARNSVFQFSVFYNILNPVRQKSNDND